MAGIGQNGSSALRQRWGRSNAQGQQRRKKPPCIRSIWPRLHIQQASPNPCAQHSSPRNGYEIAKMAFTPESARKHTRFSDSRDDDDRKNPTLTPSVGHPQRQDRKPGAPGGCRSIIIGLSGVRAPSHGMWNANDYDVSGDVGSGHKAKRARAGPGPFRVQSA